MNFDLLQAIHEKGLFMSSCSTPECNSFCVKYFTLLSSSSINNKQHSVSVICSKRSSKLLSAWKPTICYLNIIYSFVNLNFRRRQVFNSCTVAMIINSSTVVKFVITNITQYTSICHHQIHMYILKTVYTMSIQKDTYQQYNSMNK